MGKLLTLVGPVIELLGAYLSWAVYKDHMEHVPSSEAFLLDSPQLNYRSVEGNERFDERSASPELPQRSNFEAFTGAAHRLG